MATTITSGSTYIFFNWPTWQVIDLGGFNTAQGAKIIGWQANGGTNQSWKVQGVEGDAEYFFIVATIPDFPTRVLDITHGGGLGSNLIAWGGPVNGAENQMFRFIPASADGETPSFFIQSKYNDWYITNPNGAGPGQQLQGNTQGGEQQAAWQRFVAVKVA